MSANRAEQILAFAEKEMRKGGIDAVSFRDIASAIGIKSASVHYHFPTKADLSRAVVNRYARRFIEGLGSPYDPSEKPRDRLGRLCDAYMAAYRQDSSTCLCAVLGSVAMHLPEETSGEVRVFYTHLNDWIEAASREDQLRISAYLIISLLQGAMTLSIAIDNDAPLVEAKQHLMASAL